ncbi:MAG: hypothetical protein K2P58_05440 [Hyphomonadaceae bacterium]|nr:hypothetical protein [Hyphomonadaceae bacterium]
MKSAVSLTPAFALCCWALVAFCPKAAADAFSEARQHFAAITDQARCPDAAAGAYEFASSPAFLELTAEQRGAFLYEVVRCARRAENVDLALAAADLAIAHEMEFAQLLRLWVGLAFERSEVVFDAFNALPSAEVAALEGRQVWRIIHSAELSDPSGTRAREVHDRLASAGYQAPDGRHDDGIRLHHARLLLEVGDHPRATERLRGVVSASSLLSVRIDRRFDVVRSQLEAEGRLDLVAAAEAELARARSDARNNPRRLWPIADIARTLRALGRPREALAVLQPALQAAQASDGDTRFDDHSEQLNWLLNEEAYALYDLGRVNEAHVAFRFSILAREGGGPSVSQVINFAVMLQREGRAQDAIDTLSEVGLASRYGDMWVHSTRACAAVQLGRDELRDQSLAYLRQNEADNPSALSEALLCANEIDEAAAVFIRRLRNIQQRDDALRALQIYPENPRLGRALPQQRIVSERLAVVRDRPDVRSAVAEVGRIERVPLWLD